EVRMTVGLPLIVAAGLLVGFGSRMGSGCTSGHGVLGLARLSPRSMVAVATFLTAGVVSVALLRGLGL
ncbi:MAG: YeeE/YedE family protein, partial [Pseudorhizobium sp.]